MVGKILIKKNWLEKSGRKPKMSLLDLKPVNWGKGTRLASDNMDKTLYGE